MSIAGLSTELLQKIYEYSEIQELLNLARTSRRNYRAFFGRRMPLLEQGLHNSYSPLPALLQLVISNEPDKTRKPIGTEIRINLTLDKMVHHTQKPKLTLEYMKKMVEYGMIAERWTTLYPRLRWRFGSDNRRFLRAEEKERLRGAIYHHWTYTTLFHSRAYTQYSPDPPSPAAHDDPRHRLLRMYSTVEHVQLSEFLAHVEQLVELDLYPSNTIVQELYSHRLPARQLEKIAWGDGNQYRRLVRDIMKLSPADLLYLVDNTSTKLERLDFLYTKEACFGDVPATLNFALSTVSMERGRLCWGLGPSALRHVLPHLHFPSLRARIPESDKDLADESATFGIVDVAGRDGFLGLAEQIDSDGVENGEWDTYRDRYEEKFPTLPAVTDTQD